MSDDSDRESPRNNNCSGVSQHRSISDVVLSVRISCFDSDLKAAVRELKDREEGLLKEKVEIVDSLRERNDTLESDLGDWKIKYCVMEEECCRWKRDFYENDDLLRKFRRESTLAMEKEERYMRRYDRLLDEVQGLKDEKGVFNQKILDLSFMVDELKIKLKEKKDEMDEVVKRKNAELKAQLVDLEGCRESLKLDARLFELHEENEEKMEEVCRKHEDKIKQLKAQVKARWNEFELMQGTNPYLEECKAEYDACVKELRKSNEEKDEKIKKLLDEIDKVQREIIEIKKEKDDQFEELKKEKKEKDDQIEELKNEKKEKDDQIEELKNEKKEKDDQVEELKNEKKEKDDQVEELKNEKEGLGVKNMEFEAYLGQVKELVSKLEGDMFMSMCKDLETDANFASAPVGKVFSVIIKALDTEKFNLTCNAGVAKDGIPQEADAAFVSRINEPKCCLKPEKQSLVAVERLKRKLIFETETSTDDPDTGNKRPTFADPIIIDSDDENGVRPGSLNEQRNHDGSSDDTLNGLNPLHKMKKLKNALCEQVKQEPSAVLSASRSDHVLNTSQMQKLATLKKFKEKHRREDRVPLFRFSNGYNSKYSHGTPKSNYLLSPQAEELLASIQQRKQNKKLEYAVDMVCAFERDDDFCAKAVCALHRLQKPVISGVNGLIFLGSKGLEECDIGRVSGLAKILIDGDPSGKMKKSVDQLQQEDRAECRRLALKYNRQLFDIFRKREDPQFSPMSNDLQYK